MAKSPADAMASFLQKLETVTGKSVDAWVATARESGLAKHGQIVAMLKKDHGVSHAQANQIALRAIAPASAAEATSDDLIGAQYQGAKAGLKPIYDALTAAARRLGADVEFTPKKGYVSVRRAKQFAMIQPSTATRVDLGLIVKGLPPTERLEASGSFNAMFTHRVRLAKPADVDSELVGWLKQAYDQAQ